MFGQRLSLLRLCLVCTLAMVLCVQGCHKQGLACADDSDGDRTTEAAKTGHPARDEAVQPALKKAEYANDIDRLNELTNRVNRACRGYYVVVLGTGGSNAGGGLISVDYSLFDRLSNDGAAVLIAEAVVAGSRPPSGSETGTRINNERFVLEADETVGRYIARAGFGQAGFAEWLKAKNLSDDGLQHNIIPEKMRIAAFMRGYSSGRYGKAK